MSGLLSLVQPRSKDCAILPGKGAPSCSFAGARHRPQDEPVSWRATGGRRPGSISRTIGLYSRGDKLVLQSMRQMTKRCGLQEKVLSFISDKRKREKTKGTRAGGGHRAQGDAPRRPSRQTRGPGELCKKTDGSAGRPGPALEFLGCGT